MSRAEILNNMYSFNTMSEVIQFVNDLDRPATMKQILLRNCFALKVTSKVEDPYVLSGVDFKDIAVLTLPDKMYDRVEVAAWASRVSDTSILGVFAEFNGNNNEVLFYLNRPLSPAEWIQIGMSLGKYIDVYK